MTAQIRVLLLCDSTFESTDRLSSLPVHSMLTSSIDEATDALAADSFDYLLVEQSMTDALQDISTDIPIVLVPADRLAAILDGLLVADSTGEKSIPASVVAAVSNLPFGITVLSSNGGDVSVHWADEQFAHITGYDADTLVGRDWGFLAGADTDPERKETVHRTIEERRSESHIIRHYRQDGTSFWNEVIAVPLEHERMCVCFHRDVTDQLDRVRALQRQNQSLQSLHCATETLLHATDFTEAARNAVDGLSDGLDKELAGFWLQDQDDGRLHPIAASPTSQDIIDEPPIFGPNEGSVAWHAFEQKETRVVDDMRSEPDRLNPDTQVGSEIVVPLGEYGVLIIASTEPNAFRTEDVTVAELWGATVTMVFIRIQRERLLREREQEVRRERDRLDEFASLMSHDLRNPLTVANGYLELAAADVESPHLDRVQGALDRIETLITDMLTLAREGWQIGDPEAVDLEHVAREAWAIGGAEDATLETDIESHILADRSQLGQLLENLFSNAGTHGGESVTVRIGRLPDGFFVADDGVGIDPDDRADIFETGYTTSSDGTGFGLAIVAAIVDAHDWTITVTDSDSDGARFDVRNVEFVESS